MHFHIKLILSLRKMKIHLLFLEKVLTISALTQTPRHTYEGKEFYFLSCCCKGSGELTPSCHSPEHTARLEGMKYPQTQHIFM